MATPTLTSITVYPVKSLAGIGVKTWEVTATGLKYDRKWMLIDNAGHFLSQRKLPDMALIKTALADSHLVLSAPGMDDLHLPLTSNAGETVRSVVWEDQCNAISVSPEADNWLGQFLKQKCRLVYQPDDVIRPVDRNFGSAFDRIAFSDGFPFLILSENSLAALNKEMQLNFAMDRFRPNLVIGGCGSYAEDTWRQIRIGGIGFRLPKPCSRCSVPTIDQATAKISKEPLTTLNRTRKWQNKVYFGQNALHDNCGILSVGDPVEIQVTGVAQPPL